MLSEHSIAQSPRAQYGTIRVKAVRLLPKMYKFSARRVDEGSGLHGSEFPHHIHGRVQCLHLLHVLPAHRVLFPVLEAEHQRADSPARASHTHGLDSDSGFWIRIRIGLYWITDAFAIHLLSFAIILLSSSVRRRKPALFHLDSLVLIPLWEAEIRLAHTSQSRITSRPVTESMGAL